MNNLTTRTKTEIHRLGADICGFGNLEELPPAVRFDMPVGISIAIKYPKAVIRGISELPTQEYCDWYDKINKQLDSIVAQAAEFLRGQGYRAIAQTRAKVGNGENENNTVLPHKTVGTRAGIGWIGKCALLVTEEYGSMIRLSSVLTDAPLETAQPINNSKCGECNACKIACPAGAVSGKAWNVSVYRDEFFDAVKCRNTARERSLRGFGGEHTICGKCIEICPRTRKYFLHHT
jgi:epoxyqueuosine reductase QueG